MRRAVLALIVVVAAGAAVFYYLRPPSAAAPAQAAAGRSEPVGTITKIAPNLYVVPGGCNTAVFVTSHGVILVDTKWKEGWSDLVREIRTVTDQPITYAINTHRHPDHAEGNTQLPAGVKVVVHANNLAPLKEGAPIAGPGAGTWIGTAPIEFDQRLTLLEGAEAIDLYYFGAAHTSGDVFVVFRSARVMHAGDVMAGRRLPVIVLEAGGSAKTFASVIDQAAAIPNVDLTITGHGPVVSRREFAEYGELNRLMLDYVRSSMKLGSVKNSVFRAFKVPEKFKAYDVSRQFATLDEIDRSIRPRWKRVWPFTR